jgi:hypothetical protein
MTTNTPTNYPTLTGNPTDIELATADRQAMLAKLADQITTTAGNAPAALVAELIALHQEVALRHTDAGWWLANATYPLGRIVQREFTDADKARIAELRALRTA